MNSFSRRRFDTEAEGNSEWPIAMNQPINTHHTYLRRAVAYVVGQTRQEPRTNWIAVALNTRGKAHHALVTAVAMATPDVRPTVAVSSCVVALTTVRSEGVTVTSCKSKFKSGKMCTFRNMVAKNKLPLFSMNKM